MVYTKWFESDFVIDSFLRRKIIVSQRMNLIALISLGMWCGTAMVGCNSSETATTGGAANKATELGQQYVESSEPAGAISVGAARSPSATAGPIVLVGRIGGSKEPFVEGMAAFTIVDEKVPFCAPEENCPTPWDYCCQQNEVKKNIAMVKIVDDQGNVVAYDARELVHVAELNRVVVTGTSETDDQGNLTVLARTVFIHPTH